ncbi:hypothetical protein [Falsiroseomonas oryzae]|uniref:hypothetical protein n=1 Tax=Falsiroseomonas oryzae TaxID=2766473 RepID=UPI0022EAEAA0|nr:hypothetical protein [Roseomonas sp. MO-31]
MRGWIQGGQYRVLSSTGAGHAVLGDFSYDDVASYLAFDFQRFAMASLESHVACAVEVGDAASLGWVLVKAYYSAFFAAHTIIRVTGRGFIRFDSNQASFLNAVAALYVQPDAGISAGNYAFDLATNASDLAEMRIRRSPDSSGTHDMFWRYFLVFLRGIEDEVVQQGDPDQSAILAQTNLLHSLLAPPGYSNGSWLSFIRNEINYRHNFGVWLPRSLSRSERDFILNGRLSVRPRTDFEARREPIRAFLSACRSLARLSFDVTSEVVDRIDDRRARFPQTWRRLSQLALAP